MVTIEKDVTTFQGDFEVDHSIGDDCPAIVIPTRRPGFLENWSKNRAFSKATKSAAEKELTVIRSNYQETGTTLVDGDTFTGAEGTVVRFTKEVITEVYDPKKMPYLEPGSHVDRLWGVLTELQKRLVMITFPESSPYKIHTDVDSHEFILPFMTIKGDFNIQVRGGKYPIYLSLVPEFRGTLSEVHRPNLTVGEVEHFKVNEGTQPLYESLERVTSLTYWTPDTILTPKDNTPYYSAH